MHKLSFGRFPSFALACQLSATALMAQEQPQAEITDKLEVTEVLLDVLVTDASGNVILGLDKDDFVVEEEGEAVRLNGATFYSNRRFVSQLELASEIGTSPEEIPVDRYFILLYDDPRSLFPELTREHLRALRSTREWIEQDLLPNDHVAVASYNYKLRVYADFTTDRQALLDAVKALATGKDPGTQWPSRRPDSDGPSLLRNLPAGKELRKKTTRVYGALRELAEATGSIVGRKNLLFFSVGFGDLNSPAGYPLDRRYYPGTMQALNDNNVAVYTISLIQDRNEQDRVMRILSNSLNALAADTGGEYHHSFTNFGVPMRQVLKDNSGYYLLSYTARHEAGQEGYREVRVETRNPSFSVRARKGYRYGDEAPPPAPGPAPR